ncbi:dihydrodipicolinate synthase family protein [Ensifer sp. Root127]|uniref:dihydrodipicolinate synthase family protein n=1 Tax=Ensifer sp. Root127 TaxID=1736440 RepID=UPI00071036A6|nr:dihydrodipicolinate synthase family protein [Ensifer sp. Root127]KQW72439.1 dihydrodipicolinate synthetase [Ensifer sp. Root127]
MDRTSVSWSGYWPAAPTTFAADGSFDPALMRDLMNHYVDAGVGGVLINGSSGEWWSQSPEERREVARVACEAVAGRIPVVIGCTAFTAKEVIEHAQAARDCGADGVMSTPPPYAHPTQAEILNFYREIDAGIDLPLMVYNWPRGTAVEIELETAKKIADLDKVVAIKNSTGNWPVVVDYIEALADKVVIFASLINRRGIAVMRELGGDGYIDGGGMGAPFAVPFFKAFKEGRWDDARSYADKWWRLTSGLVNAGFNGHFGSPSSQLKAAMRMLDQPGGHVRAPLMPIESPETLKKIEDLLRVCGLLK